MSSNTANYTTYGTFCVLKKLPYSVPKMPTKLPLSTIEMAFKFAFGPGNDKVKTVKN